MKIFIGSSTEATKTQIFDQLPSWLEQDHHKPICWNAPHVFIAGEILFSKLIELAHTVDAALFVFADDDEVVHRSEKKYQPRDNVLIEYGIFSGVLGVNKVAIIKRQAIKLAVDLGGITCIDYSEESIYTTREKLKNWLTKISSEQFNDAKNDESNYSQHPSSTFTQLIEKYSTPQKGRIESSVLNYLKKLDPITIKMPLQRPIKPLQALSMIPRQGKHIRIIKNNLKLPIRSILDHIISLAYNADILLQALNSNLKEQDIEYIIRCIVFHDICEIIVGDVAIYTDQSECLGEQRTYSEVKAIEKTVNNFFKYIFKGRVRTDFEATISRLSRRDKITKLFIFMDHLDPIIAIWRYIYEFRNTPPFNAEAYVEAMKDFFDNPDVIKRCQEAKSSKCICDIVDYLQDKDKAIYYAKKGVFYDLPDSSKTVINQLIQRKNIFYTP